MKVLVIGTPKRDFHVGFDNLVLGLSAVGVDFDHYPNILTHSYNHTGAYQLIFDNRKISYPEYEVVIKNLKKRYYDLIITTVCHVDYSAGKHGILSQMSRILKYSIKSNKYKLGGTLVVDWMKAGLEMPPFVVIDDTDDPFIWPVDLDLLKNCLLYFKRELPYDRFFCFRLFESKLNKQQKIDLANKLMPIWISYDRDSIATATNIDRLIPFSERDIDISFLCNIHMNYNRTKILSFLDILSAKYKVITTKKGKVSKEQFYELSRRSKISISLAGRGWDCPKHYELMLCGALLFIERPWIELAVNFKHGENCIFIENNFQRFEKLVEYYLHKPILSADIARRGYEFTRKSLGNDKLVWYVLEKTKRAISNSVA